MKKRIAMPLILLMLALACVSQVSAAQPDLLQAGAKTKETPGWHTGKKGKTYYVKPNGKRAVGWKEIDGKFYYFRKNGVLSPKTGWVSLNGKKYYINSDRTRYEGGLFKIGKNLYYFNRGGAMVTNRQMCLIDGVYYNIGSDGVAVEVPTLRTQCLQEADKFIEKCVNVAQQSGINTAAVSNMEKLKYCFYYMYYYVEYAPDVTMSYAQFEEDEWYYKKAISMFQSPTLRGNCYNFACCLAACAVELGYQPTVIIVDGHGYVRINGRYFDNLHTARFNASAPYVPESKALYKVEF